MTPAAVIALACVKHRRAPLLAGAVRPILTRQHAEADVTVAGGRQRRARRARVDRAADRGARGTTGHEGRERSRWCPAANSPSGSPTSRYQALREASARVLVLLSLTMGCGLVICIGIPYDVQLFMFSCTA